MIQQRFRPNEVPADQIDRLGRSLIQHGALNRRIYLMKLHPADLPELISALERLAGEKGYEKILAKVPASSTALFRRRGFAAEARIPEFFKKQQAVVFMSKFTSARRGVERYAHLLLRHFQAVNRALPVSGAVLEPGLYLHECGVEDADEMSRLYRRVFESYPFPIVDPVYLATTMAANHRFFGIRRKDAIVALANCEMDPDSGNVEMTDFAVAPEWRGRQLAVVLLKHMEGIMARNGMHIAYSIARSHSAAVNIVFKRCGYRFGGKLTNNTHIAGRIESMWVWYKRLPDLC